MTTIIDATRRQIIDDLIMNGTLKRIEPENPELREKFISSMPPMLLFRKRGAAGYATHYVLAEKWWHLKFAQLVMVRRCYEQVCW